MAMIAAHYDDEGKNRKDLRDNPPHWTQVYPQGTKDGDEEFSFFVALSRGESKWVTVSFLARTSGLSLVRVEELLEKYFNKGMIFQHPDDEDKWAYWERRMDLVPLIEKSLAEKDHEERILRALFDMSDDVVND